MSLSVFFFNDTATTEIYTLSLHDALPISAPDGRAVDGSPSGQRWQDPDDTMRAGDDGRWRTAVAGQGVTALQRDTRSEEHTSELQSRQYLVCRLLLEKKKKNKNT